MEFHSKFLHLPPLLLLLLSLVIGAVIVESKLSVPFQEFATPKPAIAKKVYYLQEHCSICEKFRPDFTKIKLPPEENKTLSEPPTTSVSSTIVGQQSTTVEPIKVISNDADQFESNKTEEDSLKRVPRETSTEKSKKEKKTDKFSSETQKLPRIQLLQLDKNAKFDKDSSKNSTLKWRKAFENIKAKWIQAYENRTGEKIETDKSDDDVEDEQSQSEHKDKKIASKKNSIKDERIEMDESDPSELDSSEKTEINDEQEKVIEKGELEQIFLDPITQPSIIIRSKRPETESSSNDETTTSDAEKSSTLSKPRTNSTYEKCRLLIRFNTTSMSPEMLQKNSPKNVEGEEENEDVMNGGAATTSTPIDSSIDETSKNSSESKPFDLGLIINIDKIIDSMISAINKTQSQYRKNPYDDKIKIYTSDPNMTEYWYGGKKMNQWKGGEKSNRTKRSVNDPFIDLIDMDDIVTLLTQNESIDLNIANEKWILIERKIFFDDPDSDTNEELIINMYFKPKEEKEEETALEKDGKAKHKKSKRSHHKLTCPKGTFDCESNGKFCIPESLRLINLFDSLQMQWRKQLW
ncbi:hypothetical protein SSS_00890 [Sarcoptes scabiei]|nr:hypothetical protein SSS_00890 [Sarcoptes scabiei]